MSLMYKCDICGADMHRLGKNNGKRLHMDIGDLEDCNRPTDGAPIAWDFTDHPIYRIDLCEVCYNSIVLKILDMREKNGLVRDLGVVTIDGKSV